MIREYTVNLPLRLYLSFSSVSLPGLSFFSFLPLSFLFSIKISSNTINKIITEDGKSEDVKRGPRKWDPTREPFHRECFYVTGTRVFYLLPVSSFLSLFSHSLFSLFLTYTLRIPDLGLVVHSLVNSLLLIFRGILVKGFWILGRFLQKLHCEFSLFIL